MHSTLSPVSVAQTVPMSYRIHIPERMTVKQLLVRAGITAEHDVVKFFWKLAGQALTGKIVFHDAQITFFPWIKGERATMNRHLVHERLKLVTLYEVLAFAASDPPAFRTFLSQGGIILPTNWQEPFGIIRLEKEVITLGEIDREDHLIDPLFYAGVYLL